MSDNTDIDLEGDKNINVVRKRITIIKNTDIKCEHPLSETILERNYYGPDEDAHYTNYFKCDVCGEQITTDDVDIEEKIEKENLKDEERWNSD